jgi:hypothetical protein
MCTSCVSTAEAVVITGTAGITAVQSAARRLADALAGRHPVERAQEAWDANAAFARSLGLDPAAVLGDRPVAPVPDVVPAQVSGTGLVVALG